MFIETWHTSWWPYQVLTTPTSCWDGMRCLVVDSKNETGYGNVSFHNIIGMFRCCTHNSYHASSFNDIRLM